jgi:DNA-binding transcriptional MerR regulator
MSPDLDPTRGVFGISVAADMVGLDPQSLRLYERRGLLSPERTDGGTRRYSPDDIDVLNRITALLAAGVNLAGIGMVLDLQDENAQLRQKGFPR